MKTELVLSETCFVEILRLVRSLSGISIAPNKLYFVEGRLRKRLLCLNIASYDNYIALVKSCSHEAEHFIDLICTNETSFFRTPKIWEYLENTYLPTWSENNPDKTFQVWSAAASMGAEASSLGILCEEHKRKNPKFTYHILGTDISKTMIKMCQRGEYGGRVVELFKTSKPELFERHMSIASSKEYYRVSQNIRSCIEYRNHNLFHKPKTEIIYDLVLLRNVLIYFDQDDQERVISLIKPHINPTGLLIIGESESLSHIQTEFHSIAPFIYSLKDKEQILHKAS